MPHRSNGRSLQRPHTTTHPDGTASHSAARAKLWDSCAPEAILRSAGGCFTDLGGDEVVYGGEDLKNRRGILACNNRDTLAAVLDVVRDVATENGLLDEPDERDADATGGPSDGEEE